MYIRCYNNCTYTVILKLSLYVFYVQCIILYCMVLCDWKVICVVLMIQVEILNKGVIWIKMGLDYLKFVTINQTSSITHDKTIETPLTDHIWQYSWYCPICLNWILNIIYFKSIYVLLYVSISGSRVLICLYN